MRLCIQLKFNQLLKFQGEADAGKKEPVTKEKAAEILWGLAVDEGNRGDIVEVGGIPALLSLVSKGPEAGKTSAIGCLTYLLKCGNEVGVHVGNGERWQRNGKMQIEENISACYCSSVNASYCNKRAGKLY